MTEPRRPWEGSTRRVRLPADWPARRARVLTCDGHRCTASDDGTRCTRAATDVDHVHRGDNHDDTNLTSLCGWHHARKSSAEGNAARALTRMTQARPRERHPGRR
ncbi:HNH endonuclease [Catellatospora tritici]|uniref:HNH endonuclease n=1 Tax=Catellatospora tritici TaxID=2851566 RepID=UPI001C2DC8E0|nr:HNH endonuclease [Catellatospora tritici]MBV1856667.1 HNH endonuclease [Catellatospora tritici]